MRARKLTAQPIAVVLSARLLSRSAPFPWTPWTQMSEVRSAGGATLSRLWISSKATLAKSGSRMTDCSPFR